MMKFLRMIAILLAVMLCLTACGAKEEEAKTDATAVPTAEPTAEATAEALPEGPLAAANEAVMIGSLNMPYESWMTEEMYSLFAATFFMDMMYVDAYEINRLSTEIGIPAVYVGELEGDNYGNGMNLALFFTDAESGEVTMLNATVYLKTGLFEGYVTENVGDAAAMMDSFVNDGVLKVYHAITADEFMNAYFALTQVIGEMTVAQ